MDNYYTLETFYRRSNGLSQLDPPLTLDERRVIDSHWGDVTAEPGGVDYLERELGGVPVLRAEPTKAVRDRVLLCLHGGGYVGGSVYTHRKMFAHLAKAVGARAVLPSYSHTPERQYPTQLDEVTAVYRAILDGGVDPKHVAVTGDSAGGGMSVSLMLRAKAEGLPLAAALVPISPWTDMTHSGASVVTNRPTDLLFGADHPMDIDGLVTMLLPAGVSPSDPLVSPLFADLTACPRCTCRWVAARCCSMTRCAWRRRRASTVSRSSWTSYRTSSTRSRCPPGTRRRRMPRSRAWPPG